MENGLSLLKDVKEAMMEFKQKACVIYSITALFMALMYSYKGVEWVNEKYEMFFKRGDTSSPVYIALIYSALLLLVAVTVSKLCEKRRYFLYGSMFMLISLFYFFKSFLEEGTYLAITSPTTPIIYLLMLVIFIGMNNDIWDLIVKYLPVLIIVHMLLIISEYATLVAEHGVVVVGNSSLIFYYVSLFWCSVVYLSDRILQGEGIGIGQLILIGFNVIFAVIINSRSWIIQACLVGIVVYLVGSTKHTIRTKVFRVLLLILAGYIILQILNKYFPNSMILLYNKLGQNSRSHQYTEIAKASTVCGWILGNGATAVYYDSAQGYISNIDNQYIFISFHYGLIFMLMWLMPQIIIFFRVLKTRWVNIIALLPLVCWFMALGGLSIFNVVYCDLKQTLMMLYMGHIFSLTYDGGSK